VKPTHRVHHVKVPAGLEARLRSELSQRQFASILGVSRRTLEALGTGTSKADAIATDDRGKAA
jgi:DNA-binding transcriptional regulator YiaG